MPYLDEKEEQDPFKRYEQLRQRQTAQVAESSEPSPDPFERYEQINRTKLAEAPVAERGLFGDIGSHVARGVPEALRMAGRGLQVADADAYDNIGVVDRAGQWLVKQGDKLEKADFMRPDVSEAAGDESWFKGKAMEGLESLAPSITPLAVGLGVGAVASPVAGAVAGMATMGEMFFGGTYKQRMDDLAEKRPDMPINERSRLSAYDGGIEFGGELVFDVIAAFTGGVFSKAGVQGVKQGIKGMLKTTPKQFLSRFAKGAPAELATETGQAKWQSEIDKVAGTGEAMSYMEAAKEVAIPTLVMFGVLHSGATGANAIKNRQTVKDINSEDPDKRLKAFNRVYSNFGKEDADVAEAWQQYAGKALIEGKPIDTGLDFTQPDTGTLKEPIEIHEDGSVTGGVQNPTEMEPSGPLTRAAETGGQPTEPTQPTQPAETGINQAEVDQTGAFAEQSRRDQQEKRDQWYADKFGIPAEPEDFTPEGVKVAIGQMRKDMAEGEVGKRFQKDDTTDIDGQVQPGVWDGVKSTNPDWLRNTPALQKAGKARISRVMDKVQRGDKLTPKQEDLWDKLQTAAESEKKNNPALLAGEAVNRIQKEEGINVGAIDETILVGNLNPGDKVVIEQKNGVPDLLTHKGYDAEGNAILEDGETMHVNDFDQIRIIGKKSGHGEDVSASIQGDLQTINKETRPEALASAREQIVQSDNEVVKPYKEMLSGAIDRRLEELQGEKSAKEEQQTGQEKESTEETGKVGEDASTIVEKLATAVGDPDAARNSGLTGRDEESQIKSLVDDKVKQPLDLAKQFEAKGNEEKAGEFYEKAEQNGKKLIEADGEVTEQAVNEVLGEDKKSEVDVLGLMTGAVSDKEFSAQIESQAAKDQGISVEQLRKENLDSTKKTVEGARKEHGKQVNFLKKQIADFKKIIKQDKKTIKDWSSRVYKKSKKTYDKKDMYGQDSDRSSVNAANERRRQTTIANANRSIKEHEEYITELTPKLKSHQESLNEAESDYGEAKKAISKPVPSKKKPEFFTMPDGSTLSVEGEYKDGNEMYHDTKDTSEQIAALWKENLEDMADYHLGEIKQAKEEGKEIFLVKNLSIQNKKGEYKNYKGKWQKEPVYTYHLRKRDASQKPVTKKQAKKRQVVQPDLPSVETAPAPDSKGPAVETPKLTPKQRKILAAIEKSAQTQFLPGTKHKGVLFNKRSLDSMVKRGLMEKDDIGAYMVVVEQRTTTASAEITPDRGKPAPKEATSDKKTPKQPIRDIRQEGKTDDKGVSLPASGTAAVEGNAGVSAGRKVENVGEKLHGSRADKVALRKLLDEPVSEDDIRSKPLSKIWPKPKLKDLDNSFSSAFSVAARAEIPNKPRQVWKLNRWVEQVKTLRQFAQEVSTGELSPEIAEKKLKEVSTISAFSDKVEMYQAIDKEFWYKIKNLGNAPNAYRYSKEEKGEDGYPKQIPDAFASVNGKSYHYEKSFHEVLSEIEKNLRGATGKARVKFEIRGRASTGYFINKKGDSEYRHLREFDDLKDARKYHSSNYDDLVQAWEDVKSRDNVKKTDTRKKENLPRTGKDYRKGKDVDAQEFMDTFGFRGVEFGKWVSQGKGKKDRQGMLNAAYDALFDLAGILNITPKAISLNGTLGLGFGSRGHGWASAHYEPDTIVINLTKPRGAGALAHEWFHALDNYFSHKRGVKKLNKNTLDAQSAYRKNNYITYKPEPAYVHPKLPGTHTKAQMERWKRNPETFGQGWTKDPAHPAGVRPEVEVKFADLVNVLNESGMAKRSRRIDKGKSEGYWSQIIERAARSFENYAISKMQDEGYSNDYLANVVSFGDFKRNKERYPYLTEEEIGPVKEAFDNLFSEIKTKETDKGVALYSKSTTPLSNPADLQAELSSKKNLGRAGLRNLVRKGLKIVNQARAEQVLKHHLGAWFSYAGKKSALADQSALFNAIRMQKFGEDAETIRQETGWHLGKDNRWRYEIDDSKAELINELKEGRVAPLGKFMKHDELFNAYPELKNIEVSVKNLGGHAGKYITGEGGNVGRLEINPLKGNPEETIFHELQHVVQQIEGFAPGGSPTFELEKYKKEASKAEKMLGVLYHASKDAEGTAEEDAITKAFNDFADDVQESGLLNIVKQKKKAFRDYKFLLGEIEARDVAERKDLSSEQRKALPPYISQGIPMEQAIVRVNVADSIKYSKDGRIEAFTLPDGTVYMVDGNIRKGEAMAVLSHELGVHAKQLGFKETKQFKRIMNLLKRRSKADTAEGKAIREAMDRVPADTKPEHRNEEALAYLITNSPEIGIVRRFIAALKKFIVEKFGVTERILQNIDLQALALAVVKSEAASPLVKESFTTGINQFAQPIKASVVEKTAKDLIFEEPEKIASWVRAEFKKVVSSKDEYEDIGLRINTNPLTVARDEDIDRLGLVAPDTVEVGEELHDNSFVWNEERPTDEERSGVSVIGLESDGSNLEEAIKAITGYFNGDDQLIMVTGLRTGTGFDEMEDILERSVVAAVYSPPQTKPIQKTGTYDATNPDIRKSYAGGRSKTADKSKLAEAMKMFYRKEDAEKIRKQTGWHLGADKHWRYELDDSTAAFALVDNLTKQEDHGREWREGKLSDLIVHKELFKAYPEIADMKVIAYPWASNEKTRGIFRPESKAIGMPSSITLFNVKGDNLTKGQKKTLLHEIQHAIQHIEGFAAGGNPTEFKGRASFSKKVLVGLQASAWLQDLKEPSGTWDDAISDFKKITGITAKSHQLSYAKKVSPDRIKKEIAEARKTADPFAMYQRLFGEIEARDTADRLGLDKTGRKNTEPYTNQGIPMEDAIVRFSDTTVDGHKINYSIAAADQADADLAEDLGSITEIASGKPDILQGESIISTPEYTLYKSPTGWRMFNAASRRRENKVKIENEILDGITENDTPEQFQKKHQSFVKWFNDLKKNFAEQYKKANDYILRVDRTGKAYRVKHFDGYEAKTPDGKVLGVSVTKAEAYEMVQTHHRVNYGKGLKPYMNEYPIEEISKWQVLDPKGKSLSEYENQGEAAAAMIEAEAEKMAEKGYQPTEIEAVVKFRNMANRAFDRMIDDYQKIVDDAKDKGLDEPTVAVVDETKRYGVFAPNATAATAAYESKEQADEHIKELGKVDHKYFKYKVKRQKDGQIRVETKLTTAIAMMGDLRGSYFPRQRQRGGVVLMATNKDGRKLREHFDLYLTKRKKFNPMTGAEIQPGKLKSLLRKSFNRYTPLGKRMRELKKQGFNVTVDKSKAMPESVFEAAQLMTSINAMMEAGMEKADTEGTEVQAAYHELNKMLSHSIADIFKARGGMSSRLKRAREYWEGFETDMTTAGVQYAKGLAATIAKRQAAQEMTEALTGRDVSWMKFNEENPDATWDEYQEFVNNRMLDPKEQPNLFKEAMSWMKEVLRNDEQADRILNTFKGLAVLKFLGFRVSSATVNMTNLYQGVPATISSHSGGTITGALAEVTRSLKALHEYNKGNGSDLDKRIFTQINEYGWAMAQFNHENAAQLRSSVGNKYAKFVDASMWMFSKAETINRASTIHAAYMQFKKNNPGMKHADLMKRAHHASERSHGIYGTIASPVWTRGTANVLRAGYTFKRFSHSYMLNMGEMVGRGDYKQAMYMLLSPAILAGGGATLATPVIAGIVSALGGGDDPEEEFYKWASETFGSDRPFRHGIAGLAGVNLKGSLQMNMPFPTNAKELIGAPGSVLTDLKAGAEHALKGEGGKAIEKILPAGFGNVSKAIREYREGITTGSYGPVYFGNEPLKGTMADAFLRGISFNPSRLSGIREMQWSERKVAKKYQDKATKIRSRIKKMLIQHGGYDRETWGDIMADIYKYNEVVRGLGRRDIKPIHPQKTLRRMYLQVNRAPKRERLRKQAA